VCKILKVCDLVYETNRLVIKGVNARFTLLKRVIRIVELQASCTLSHGDFSRNIAYSATCCLG
jgi:hypothetical protein